MIRLLTTYYKEKRPDRRAELDLCLALNAMVCRLCVLSETIPTYVGEWRLAQQRQKYRDLLDWAAADSGPDDINIIANCDILIPAPSVELIREHLSESEAYCLSRYEIGQGGEHLLNNSEWSQDVWVFRGPPRVTGGDYFFGVPGCDNRFAHEIDASGYAVSNPSKSIKTFHIHTSRQRTPTNSAAHRISPPYLLPSPSFLGEPTQLRRIETMEQIHQPRRQPVAPAV